MSHPSPDDDDQALRQALRASLPTADPSSEALQARVLAQWQQRHAAAARPAAVLALNRRRGRLMMGLAALTIGAAVVAWCARPDPVMDELMQLDVLSQMAIGEL